MILIDAKIVFFLMLSSAIYNKSPGIQTFVRGNPIFAPAATLADPPVRRTGLPAHETTSTGPPVSEQGLPAHETALADPHVRRTGLSAHEEGVRKYVVRSMIDNGWRGIGLETWQSLREHIHKE